MPEYSSNSSDPMSNENVARILTLLKTRDEKIGSTRVDKAILIVGKSGSAGNNEDLVSRACEPILDEFLSSAVSSKLIRPKKNSHFKLAFNYRDYFGMLKTADEEKIDRYFIDRANKEVELVEDMVKIVSSDISHALERTISEICGFSSNIDDFINLERNLLKLKLLSVSKLAEDILDLVASLMKVSLAPVQIIRTTKILPSDKISTSDVDRSIIEAKLASIEEVTQKEIYAIKGAMLNEIRSLQSLGDEFHLAIDQLRDVEANLRPRPSIMDQVTSTAMFFNVSDQIQTIRGINSALLMNYGPKVNESVTNFENDVKIVQWNVDLHDALAKVEFNRTDLTSFIDHLREKESNFVETVRDVLGMLKSVIFPLIRMSRANDFYGPERKVVTNYLGEFKSKIPALVSDLVADIDFVSISENLGDIFNQLVTIVDEPAQHNRAVFSCLHLLPMKEVSGDDDVQNYFTNMISGDKLLYEYEHLIDVCKTSIFPFDILTNRKLDFPVIPHVDKSSMQHQSIIASKIEQLETEMDFWEQRINNVTTSEEFNSGNDNGPFSVWGYGPYEDSIRKLLRGRAVVLKASHDFADKRQWLKFDNIRLRFTSGNSTVQQSLDEDLKYFNVSMTHVGDSHFRLCNDVRLVRHDATRFSLDFNETTAEVVDPRNSSLKPVLSPFATWIFKLHPIDEDVTFSILNPYRKLDIGIELEGNATFIKSVNRTMCQKIALSDSDIHQLPSRDDNNSVEQFQGGSITRKRRDIDSSSSDSGNRVFNWSNPFNYFFSGKSEPKPELPAKTPFLGQNGEHLTKLDYCQFLNINGTLALVDFFVRKITKIKPCQSMEKSTSSEEARVIALNIIEELENKLKKVPEDEYFSWSIWHGKDPIEVMCLLEKAIFAGDLLKMKYILADLIPLDVSDYELDSLLERHLSCAGIRRSDADANALDNLPDGGGHFSDVLNNDFINPGGISSMHNENLNLTLLN